jgi:predicted RNA binding protein YcfA (HicA-like mRNA interferase family)
VRRRPIAAGYAEVSQQGSHIKFVGHMQDGIRTAIVPKHREIAVGTLRSILRQAGLTPEDFTKL